MNDIKEYSEIALELIIGLENKMQRAKIHIQLINPKGLFHMLTDQQSIWERHSLTDGPSLDFKNKCMIKSFHSSNNQNKDGNPHIIYKQNNENLWRFYYLSNNINLQQLIYIYQYLILYQIIFNCMEIDS